MKESFVPSDFAALIGIDWADKKHDICELPLGSDKPAFSIIGAGAKSLTQWAVDLRDRYPGGIIAVACELKKGPLIYALERFDHIVIFPINPQTVANYRKTFTVSGAKNDPSDAFTQAELLLGHMDKLSPLIPDEPEIRALSQLTEQRRSIVQDRVALTNKITSLLKNYYPQVLSWFKDKDTLIFCEFLTRWPTPEKAQKARKSTLLKFFNEHNSRYTKVTEERIEKIKNLTLLTKDRGVIESNQAVIEVLVAQLKVLIVGIEKLDKNIQSRHKSHRDSKIFDSFPGAGPQYAPRLLAAFGSNRNRFKTAAALQKYSGVAPVIEQSGQKAWTHWRYCCPKFLRQTFVEWAGQSVRFSFWARAYYNQQIDAGKPHNTVIRSLAFKWIRIAFKCWKDRKPYDESTYLEALKQRGSPLLEYASNTPK